MEQRGSRFRPPLPSLKKYHLLFLGVIIVAVGAILWPLPAAFDSKSPVSLRIADRTGKLLYDVRHTGVQHEGSSEIPIAFRDAVIATEDRTFTTNLGFSIRGILRALLKDLEAGRVVQGGSTITQQYVRSVLQPRRRGVLYKIREIFLAFKLTLRSSKKKILQDYVDTVYFGQQAYGLTAAARIYFDKEPEHLSIAESALLVGLLNAPSSLNPFKDLGSALERRDLVLRSMLVAKKISQEEFEEAIEEPVTLTRGAVSIEAPHFVFWLLELHRELRSKGGEVRTTIDLDLQHSVEEIIQNRLSNLHEKNVSSAAVVVLDAKNGDILSMVGSADYFDDDHDGAVNVAVSPRQPGSALKPFTYAIAFAQGMTPATTVVDVSTQFLTQSGNPYIPRNYDYEEHGLVRLREALANSLNISAVKVLQKVGVGRLLTLLTRAGISTLSESAEHYGLALTLGDAEVTLLDLSKAYGIFARNGETLSARSLLSDPVLRGDRVLDSKVAWLVTDILSDNDARAKEFGRDGPLAFPFPVAAKTGTTRNSRDNWTVGYTPDHIVGVWVGNADNTPMRDTSGVTGAGPIFHDVMMQVARETTARSFQRPAGIVEKEICKISGLLPTPLCAERTTEYFIEGSEPTQRDSIVISLRIDTRNGLRASDACPEEYIEELVFFDFPQELWPWAREHNKPLPPHDFSPLCPQLSSVASGGPVTIVRPAPDQSYKLDPLVPDSQESVIFEAISDREKLVQWYVDGVHVGDGKAPDFRYAWKPTLGKHEVRAGKDPKAPSVSIEVIE